MSSVSEEDRDLLVSRYEDLHWIDYVTGYQCARCPKVLIRHYEANSCGHKFCWDCEKLWLENGSTSQRCPLADCRKIIENTNTPEAQFDYHVFDLRAHCPNHKHGCSFIAQLRNIAPHSRICTWKGTTKDKAIKLDNEHVLKTMTKLNEKMETMSLVLNEVQKSLGEMKESRAMQDRKWMEMDRKWMETERKVSRAAGDLQEMSVRIFSAINNEGKKVKENAEEILKLKGKAENWLELLEFKDRKCTKKSQELEREMEGISTRYGDEIIALKKKLDETEEKLRVKEIISAAAEVSDDVTQVEVVNTVINPEKLNEIEEESKIKETPSLTPEVNYDVTKPEVQPIQIADEYYTKTPDFIWSVNNVNNIMNGTVLRTTSAVFPLTGYPFCARVRLTVDQDKQLWFGLAYKLTTNNPPVKVKLLPTVFWTLKDGSGERKDVISSYVPLYKEQQPFRYDTFSRSPFNFDDQTLTSSAYNRNNSWLLHIHVEPPAVARAVFSHNGTLSWRIEEYRKRKEREEECLVESCLNPYFYTSDKGYRVQVETYLNGNAEYQNTGLTLQINFVSGLYDANLANSFRHKTTVRVFHPAQPRKNITKSVERNIKQHLWYNINVGTHAQVQDLLQNDALHYDVSVAAV